MPQTMQRKLPKSFVPDALDTSDTPDSTRAPKSFIPDAPISRGASGSWDASDTPKLDMAQQFQTEHPLLSSPVTAIARFGKGAVDMVTGTAKGIYEAATEPRRPDETTPTGLLTAKRVIVDPMREEARKSSEATTGLEAFGHGLASKLPLIGPGIASMTEQATGGELPEALGGLALSIVAPGLLKEYGPRFGLGKTGKTGKAVPTEQSVSAVSTMIESGVKNDLVNSYAEQTIPLWRQAAAELGKAPEQFPASTAQLRVPGTRAGITTETGRRAVRQGGEHAIEIADHAVDITNRPFESVLRQHGQASIAPIGTPPHLTVKGGLLADLDSAIAENSNNPALVRALKDLRSRAERTGTYNDLQALKALSNKKANALFDRSLGAQINASADAAYSWKILGDRIRANMYPELSALSGTDLSIAGRLEGIVMDARDGLRRHFYKDVLNPHNKRMQQTYWEYVRDGSLAQRSMLKRALMLEPTPAGAFNQRFVRGMGEIPPMPSSVPFTPKGPPSLAAPSTLTGTQLPLSAVAAESAPAGGTGPLLAGPTASPVQDYLTQQRQRNIWTQGQPTPQPGEQLSLMRGMTPEAAPQSTMGMRQTPVRFNPMERTAYTMQDLRSMAQEIADFVQRNPNHPEVQALKKDLDAVKNELDRRVQAHKTPSKGPSKSSSSSSRSTPGDTGDINF